MCFLVFQPLGRELKTGEIGGLVATGPNIMGGYWRDPESTAKKLDEHGYYTGDQGYVDAEGFFFLVGRDKCLSMVGT